MPRESDLANWTNPSLQLLAPDADPIATVSALVSELLLAAADAGATGPATNPFELAELMGIGLRPHYDVVDARLVAAVATEADLAAGRQAPLGRFVPSAVPLTIEYNPTKPRGRLRYSVAHELAHALFPDASAEVRNRSHTGAVDDSASNSWQLELICNIAAAEMLMPTAAIDALVNTATDIDFLMAERARFNVSTEALLRRLVHATDRPMALAAFHRATDAADAPLRCEYVLSSRSWEAPIGRGSAISQPTVLTTPTAVGQTARGTLTVPGSGENLAFQAVGVPPYPGRRLPRIFALLAPPGSEEPSTTSLAFVTADITTAWTQVDAPPEGERGDQPLDARREQPPTGSDHPVLVAHVVSDAAHVWSRHAVAGALRAKLPGVAREFQQWSFTDDNLALGNVHFADVPNPLGRPLTVASMVAQQGYGPSATPRLAYAALASALAKVSQRAQRSGAEVHIPRIGAGQAGGRWDLIEAAVERTMRDAGVRVVVYTLPGADAGRAARTAK